MRVGDTLICSKNYYEDGIWMFAKNETYKILESNYHSYYIPLSNRGYPHNSIPRHLIDVYFYSPKEVRKQKLKKLDDIKKKTITI